MSAAILGTVFLYPDYTFPIDKLREELTDFLHKKYPETLPKSKVDIAPHPDK